MGNYIKYQRFTKKLYEIDLQDFFDELIRGGWIIIHYDEKKITPNVENNAHNDTKGDFLEIIIIAGKTANLIKGVL